MIKDSEIGVSREVPLAPDERADRDGNTDPSKTGSARREQLALAWLARAAVLVVFRLMLPVGLGILLGALTAFTTEPLYARLVKRTKSPGASALVMVVGTALMLLGALAGLLVLFVDRGVGFGGMLVNAFTPDGQGTHALAFATKHLSRFGVNHEMLLGKAREGAAAVAEHAAALAGSVAQIFGEGALALFFLLLTMHLFLRTWYQMLPRAEAVFPLRPDYTRALFEEFRKVGRTTLQGTIVTGIAQGTLAGIGYAIAGVPNAIFFGVLTALASLIPAVGTLLVWVPAGVVLLLSGHSLAGIFELIWGALCVVGLSDYVIRPRLVGGDEDTPALLTFASLFGGVEVFGLQGLIVGPLLMSLALAVLKIYEREAISRRRAALATLTVP
ncbi:MAG: AI-2E family transporter [Polyangiaceae bacterium]